MPGPGTWSPGDILTAADLNAIGTWASYTPVLTQGVARTATVNYAKYMVINKMCLVNVDLTCTTTGSLATITVSLPVNTGSASDRYMGSGVFFDSSASNVDLIVCNRASSSTVELYSDASNGVVNTTLGNNDTISFYLAYEAT